MPPTQRHHHHQKGHGHAVNIPAADMIELVNEYLDLCATIEEDTARKTALAAHIAAQIEPGERFEIKPGIGVKVMAPSARFNADRARAILTPEQLAAISETHPTVAGLKFLPPVIADLCRVSTGPPSVQKIR